MTSKLLLAREIASGPFPLDAPPEWIPFAPFGRFWNVGANAWMDSTPELWNRLVATWRANYSDLPVDWEHALESPDADPRARKAVAAYLDDFEVRADGVFAHVRNWTPEGADDVVNGRYRYISPAMRPAANVRTGAREWQLTSAALVVIPGFGDAARPLAASRHETSSSGDAGDPNDKEQAMTKVLELLKANGETVDAGAGDDLIAAAFSRVIAKRDDEHKAALEAAKAEAETAKTQAANAVPERLAVAFGRADITMDDAVALAMSAKGAGSVETKIAELETKVIAMSRAEDEKLLTDAIAAGKIDPAEKDFYEKNLQFNRTATVDRLAKLAPKGPAAPPLHPDGKARATGANSFVLAFARELGVDGKKAEAKLQN